MGAGFKSFGVVEAGCKFTESPLEAAKELL